MPKYPSGEKITASRLAIDMAFDINPEQDQHQIEIALESAKMSLATFIFFSRLIKKSLGSTNRIDLNEIQRNRAINGFTNAISIAYTSDTFFTLVGGSTLLELFSVDMKPSDGLTYVLPENVEPISSGQLGEEMSIGIDDYFCHWAGKNETARMYIGSRYDRIYAPLEQVGRTLLGSTPSKIYWVAD